MNLFAVKVALDEIRSRITFQNIKQKLRESAGSGMWELVLGALFLIAVYALNPSIKTFVTGLWTTVSTFFTTIFTNAFKTS